MCGVIGYVGSSECVDLLMHGLRRLEYRGYDSAGVCVITRAGDLVIHKRAGRVADLEAILPVETERATIGMAHTRWATHGAPTDINAHPQLSADGRIAVIHNGIIENSSALRRQLEAKGIVFVSETDTEVIPNLISQHYSGDLKLAVTKALAHLHGSYGLVVMAADQPELMVVARLGSPLVLGVGDGEMLVASDASALISRTRGVVYLDDGEVAVLRPDGYQITDQQNRQRDKEIARIEWEVEQMDRGEHKTYFIKEVLEQPDAIRMGLRGRVDSRNGDAVLGGLNDIHSQLAGVRSIQLLACGGSNNACIAAKGIIEELARLPCVTEVASEVVSRNPIVNRDTLYCAVSQSGETADTLTAMREIKRKGGTVLGVVNVIGSSIARESAAGIYLRSGPEIAVCSTKAYMSQMLALTLFALKLGRMRDLSQESGSQIIAALQLLPEQMERVLHQEDAIRTIARDIARATHTLFLGRGPSYAAAIEGALKLKEVSYIPSEGISAAEMKHGPIALIEPNMWVIFICPVGRVREKSLSNLKELRARNAHIFAVCNTGDEQVKDLADHWIEVPETHELLSPFLTVIPLQLLAYHVALILGRDVDKPRHLAKSVTVE